MKIITGASRGIGKYLLERYHDEYETVEGVFFYTEPYARYYDHYSRLDISDFAEVSDWLNDIDIGDRVELINCAGIYYNSFAHDSEIDKWERVIEINLVGTFNVIRALLPHMRCHNYGRIVNLSSVVDKLGIAGTSAYAASKSGLEGLVKVLAIENASKGITINNLRLGYFDIGMGREIPSSLKGKISERIPTHKFGRPDHIYDAIEFLIKNDYINGSSLDLNGGLT